MMSHIPVQTINQSKIDLSKPRWDQSTYWGRAKHFLLLTNPLNVLATNKQLDEAKSVIDTFKKTGNMPPGYDENKLWAAKYLHDSAFHPDTGEKMFVLGRMAAQAPMNTLITAGMITFYKTTRGTVFWQWTNQTFNAIVNYTNRSGDAPIAVPKLVASYIAACGGALGTALYLNKKTKTMKPIFARFVPFAAVMGANFINIPMMRSSEITNGTPVSTREGHRLGLSRRAAAYGIFLVVISRVTMATPGMILTPILTNVALRKGLKPNMVLPFQLALVGACVTFATPLACAIFDQNCAFPVQRLESDVKEAAEAKHAKFVYFNKGL